MLCIKWTLKILFMSLVTAYTVYISMEISSRQINFGVFKIKSNRSENLLPWYFKNGTIWPNSEDRKLIWPNETAEDRLLTQLMYVPLKKSVRSKKMFVVFAKYAYKFQIKIGKKIFDDLKCPIDDCVLVENRTEADAVIFGNNQLEERNSAIPQKQIWIFYVLENPLRPKFGNAKGINWTATYRRDSDIEVPYAKWLYYNETVKFQNQEKNYAAGRNKKVAWFVSNCNNTKNRRMEYAQELGKYIQVDIYGKCGDKECSRDEKIKCLEMLSKEYKFYLAFENANCRDYITEKFFLNSLQYDILPIVMGARPEDYERVAPYNSYIHVDYFSSAKDLADYLKVLDKNDYLYNSYFRWKGTGEFINTYFFCRVCAMLHSDYSVKSYGNFSSWWNASDVCVEGSWLKAKG